MKNDNIITEKFQRMACESRSMIASHYAGLQKELDVATRLRHSIQQKPWTWIGGALFAGGITSFFKNHPRLEKKTASLANNNTTSESTSAIAKNSLASQLFSASRFLFPLVRPVITAYATRKISHLSEHLEKKN